MKVNNLPSRSSHDARCCLARTACRSPWRSPSCFWCTRNQDASRAIHIRRPRDCYRCHHVDSPSSCFLSLSLARGKIGQQIWFSCSFFSLLISPSLCVSCRLIIPIITPNNILSDNILQFKVQHPVIRFTVCRREFKKSQHVGCVLSQENKN